MRFYNIDGEVNNYHLLSKIGGGSYSRVYMLSPFQCIKIFRELDNGINYEDVDFINSLNLDNFYKIYSLLFNKTGIFRGYTMKYYIPIYESIFLKSSEYTLDNFYSIEKSIDILSKHNIFIPDLHSDNVVLGKDEITVIDTDIYSKAMLFDNDKLSMRNKRALFNLFRMIYIDNLCSYHYYNDNDIGVINNLFDFDNPSKVKVLMKYKYPIDYIKDMRK